jgi:RNA 2',3'-cyclic 3'-phosphodiesterase
MTARRGFVALELEQQVALELVLAVAELRLLLPNWRQDKWVAEQNLHVTLKFLGDMEPGNLETLRGGLDDVFADMKPFAMPLAGLRATPSHGRHSMIWATFEDPADRCAQMAASIDRLAEGFGVAADTRPIVAHVTLVRARKPKRLSAEALVSVNTHLAGRSVSMSVLSATLFASTLTRTGPVYERLANWAFSTRDIE